MVGWREEAIIKLKARVTQRKQNPHSRAQGPSRCCSWRQRRRERNNLAFLFFLPLTPIDRTWLEASWHGSLGDVSLWYIPWLRAEQQISGQAGSELAQTLSNWLALGTILYGQHLLWAIESQLWRCHSTRNILEPRSLLSISSSLRKVELGESACPALVFQIPSLLFLYLLPFPFFFSQAGLKGNVKNIIVSLKPNTYKTWKILFSDKR